MAEPAGRGCQRLHRHGQGPGRDPDRVDRGARHLSETDPAARPSANGPGEAGPVAEGLVGDWLGRVGFEDALSRQLAARDALIAGEGPPTVFSVEHPPTLTLGRRGEASDVLWDKARLEAAGIAVCETPRGGQVTLHAPGQLVVYPVVRIGWRVRAHITHLGEAAATLLRELGVAQAAFRLDHPGVWVGPRKIASIGVHVSRGVTVQGIAINLAVRRALFGALVSCGLPDVTMANAVEEGARAVALGEAARRYTELLAQAWGQPLRWRKAP